MLVQKKKQKSYQHTERKKKPKSICKIIFKFLERLTRSFDSIKFCRFFYFVSSKFYFVLFEVIHHEFQVHIQCITVRKRNPKIITISLIKRQRERKRVGFSSQSVLSEKNSNNRDSNNCGSSGGSSSSTKK